MDEELIGQHKPIGGRGAPPFKPTTGQRIMVRKLATLGFTQQQICDGLGLTKPTLEKYYNDELQAGYVETNAKVAGALFNSCMEGNVSAQIFWSKARMGWSEKQIIEHQGLSVNINGEDAEL